MKKNKNNTTKERKGLSRKVGYMIRTARKSQGLSQQELAEKIGTQQPSIARVESGLVLPTLGFLNEITNSLGMELNVLVSPKVLQT